MTREVKQYTPQAPVYNAPRRPAWHMHLIAGAIVAVVGIALMLTGALLGYGIVVLSIGVLYAAAAFVIGSIQGRGSPEMQTTPLADRRDL